MKIIHVRCLRCNEPVAEHRRSMQVVAAEDAAPKPGFSMNLYQCMANGGLRMGQSSNDQRQQGEGRFYTPPSQMR